MLNTEGNRGCTDTSWCQVLRETEAVQILLGAKHGGKQRLYRYFLMPSKEGNRGCTDTSWCQARRDTEAVQILLGAEQGGIQRLYKYFLVPSKEGYRGCTDTHFLVPSKEPPMPAQPCTCVQPTGRICTPTNSITMHLQLVCPTGTPAAVRVDFISTSAKPVLVYTEKDEEKSGHTHTTQCSSPPFHQRISVYVQES